MADTSYSAAERVFGIAELTENILFHLAHAGIEQQGDEDDLLNPQPLTCLAAVRRVNSMIRDTITISPKLRRLINSNPIPKRSDWSVGWFLSHELGLKGGKRLDKKGPDGSNCYDFTIGKIDLADDDTRNLFDAFNSDYKKTSPHAPWRSVKISPKNASSPIEYKIKRVNWAGDCSTGYTERWHFKPDDTLGQLFDKYRELMKRSLAKHRRIDESSD